MMRKHCLTREDGFTLVEMIIVTAIFVVVIMLTTHAFNTVLTQSKKVSKSEESNIEGVIGLEMFRHDLGQAGFGLFNEVDNPAPDYLETDSSKAPSAFLYNDNNNLSDNPGRIPRAYVAGNNITGDPGVLANTDYLAIKASTVALNQTSQKWTYISGTTTPAKIWGTNDLTTNDYVVAVSQKYVNGILKRKLIYELNNTDSFSVKFESTAAAYADPFGPPSDTVQYYYFGISSTVPRAPFNRTDYFVKRTDTTPKSCAPGAGVLYKANMNHADGGLTEIPILDCVADMQVVFGWSTTDPPLPNLDTYTNADLSTSSSSLSWTPSLADPIAINKHLRLIKVYILAQDGGKDVNFKNTDTAMPVGVAGEANSLAHTIDLTGPNYQNYRWKLYRIVVKPKNLI